MVLVASIVAQQGRRTILIIDENVQVPVVVEVSVSGAPAAVRPVHRRTPLVIGLVRGVRVVKVQPAIVVEVSKVCSHGSFFHAILIESGSGQHSNFLELSLSQVVVKKVGCQIIGHKNVGPAIIVVITNDDTHSV